MIYATLKAAIATWCATNGYTPRAEVASTDGVHLPERFVLYTQDSHAGVWYSDARVRKEYRISVDVAVPEAELARLPGDFEGLDAVLIEAGFVPTGAFGIQHDRDAVKAYVTATYVYRE